ncbi:bacillithiol biosynthesis cysteine-adding enzyme BshC [bacterium]|nr:bacillithiol biosynthesis cysteine-adding enzyme BshC [bacterium]NUN44769.1 bacillithiol biosynthesis cysteine-adding enzyme BshC [bacterium]
MTISFRELKNTTSLFTDYLYSPEKTASFFSANPSDQKAWPDTFSEVLKKYKTNRDLLSDILVDQQHRFQSAKQALENVALLRQPNTVAVVTGQQTGLLGGPIYTVLKALGTVKYCQLLKTKFPVYNFVPVFWLELEDHDFEEVRSTQLINIQNELVKIFYDGGISENQNKTPVHRFALTDDISRIIEELKTALNPTDFSQALFDTITKSYQPGKPWAEAFGMLLSSWLSPMGLVLMDPSDVRFKGIVKPIFERALKESESLHEAVLNQSNALKAAGYHVQVETEPSYVFLTDYGENKFSFNGKGHDKIRITRDIWKTHKNDILNILENEPQRFIPNVILRPLIQDTLLPTVFYVAGPGEIAYFAQFRDLYTHMDMTSPVIIPRPFFTLVEKKIKKVLDKYQITIADIINDGETVIERINQQSNVSLEPALLRFMNEVQNGMKNLEPQLTAIDASLKGASATAMDKMQQAMQVLTQKTREAEKRAALTAHGQLTKAMLHIRPNGNFQERELSMLYYLNKYGFTLFDTISENITLDSWDHRLIEL